MLALTAENFRSEIARHRLTRETVASMIDMHPNQLSMFLTGTRPLTDWAGHNIGWAINMTTGLMIFSVNMRRGPLQAPKGRPSPDESGDPLDGLIRKRRRGTPYRTRPRRAP